MKTAGGNGHLGVGGTAAAPAAVPTGNAAFHPPRRPHPGHRRETMLCSVSQTVPCCHELSAFNFKSNEPAVIGGAHEITAQEFGGAILSHGEGLGGGAGDSVSLCVQARFPASSGDFQPCPAGMGTWGGRAVGPSVSWGSQGAPLTERRAAKQGRVCLRQEPGPVRGESPCYWLSCVPPNIHMSKP